LLGNRRSAGDDAARPKVTGRRRKQRTRIEAVMAVEALILERHGDPRQVGAQARERQRMTTARRLFGKFRQRVAARVEQRERALHWVGTQQRRR
jgi:hypothetical protein